MPYTLWPPAVTGDLARVRAAVGALPAVPAGARGQVVVARRTTAWPERRGAILAPCASRLPPRPGPTPGYTHGHHESVLRSHRWRTAANSAAYLLPHLGPGITLLDVGCGPGTITVDLARRVAPGAVVGVDRSGRSGPGPRATRRASTVEFGVGDVYALAFDDVLRRRARPPGAPAPRGPGRGPAGDAAGVPARRLRRRPRRRLRGDDLVPALPGLDEWLALYRRASPGQQRGAGRGPQRCSPGRTGRARRGRGDGVGVVLHGSGRRMVGRLVGGPDHTSSIGPGRSSGVADQAAPRPDRRGVAVVGGPPRRVVHDHLGGDPLPRPRFEAVAHPVSFPACRSTECWATMS